MAACNWKLHQHYELSYLSMQSWSPRIFLFSRFLSDGAGLWGVMLGNEAR